MGKIIKPTPAEANRINKNIDTRNEYPIFDFRLFNKKCLKACENRQLCDFVSRMQELSQLNWNTIDTADRHGFGYEKMRVEQLKITLNPDIKEVLVFRYSGKLPFIGLRQGNTLQVLYLEANFGDLYDHS